MEYDISHAWETNFMEADGMKYCVIIYFK
jgi:hypothetical protein